MFYGQLKYSKGPKERIKGGKKLFLLIYNKEKNETFFIEIHSLFNNTIIDALHYHKSFTLNG